MMPYLNGNDASNICPAGNGLHRLKQTMSAYPGSYSSSVCGSVKFTGIDVSTGLGAVVYVDVANIGFSKVC
jgi:hypothetical protein